VNRPYIAYLDLVEDVRLPSLDYRTGVYFIQNFFEVIEFLRMLKKRHVTLRDFILPYRKTKVFWMPVLDDPLPFVVGSWELTKAIFRSIIERLSMGLFGGRGKK